MAIWQDLVDDHGFPAGYASVRRFVSTVRQQPAVEARAVITTDRGEEAQVDYGEGRWSVTRTPASTAGTALRPDPGLLAQGRPAVGSPFQRTGLGRAARAGVPSPGGHRTRRRPRQPQGGRPHPGHLRPDAESALSRRARPLRRRPPAVPRPRSRSEGQGRGQRRPRPENGCAASASSASTTARRTWTAGSSAGPTPASTHDQAPSRRHVRGRTARARPVCPSSRSATTSTAAAVCIWTVASRSPRPTIRRRPDGSDAASTCSGTTSTSPPRPGHRPLLREHCAPSGAGIASPTTTGPPAPRRRPSPCSPPPSGPVPPSPPSATTSTGHEGAAGVRRILGVLSLVKKHGPAVVEHAATAALELGVPTYRFLSATSTATPARRRCRCARSTRSSAN